MHNVFNQNQATDYDILLKTFDKVLSQERISNEAICATCVDFMSGDVKGGSLDRVPKLPEFLARARVRQEYIDVRNKPRIEHVAVGRLPANHFMERWRRGEIEPIDVSQYNKAAILDDVVSSIDITGDVE